MSAHLTDAEERELAGFVKGANRAHEPFGWDATTKGLHAAVERILTARLAAVEAEMEVCPSGIHGWRQRTPRGTCPWCDAEAAEAERDRLAVAVERVEALADDWAELTFDDPEPDWSDDLIAALSDAGRGE